MTASTRAEGGFDASTRAEGGGTPQADAPGAGTKETAPDVSTTDSVAGNLLALCVALYWLLLASAPWSAGRSASRLGSLARGAARKVLEGRRRGDGRPGARRAAPAGTWSRRAS